MTTINSKLNESNKPVIFVATRKVSCSGDIKRGLGHPKVYLKPSNINSNTYGCPYCGQIYEYVNPTQSNFTTTKAYNGRK